VAQVAVCSAIRTKTQCGRNVYFLTLDLVVPIVTTRIYRSKFVSVSTGLYDSAQGPVKGCCEHKTESKFIVFIRVICAPAYFGHPNF